MSSPVLVSSSIADRERVRAVFDRLFPPPRSFSIRLWDGTEWSAAGPAQFRLVLAHPGALHRMLRPPIEPSLGEAYIHGDFDIEGDLPAAFAGLSAMLARPLTLAGAAMGLRDYLNLPDAGPARSAGRGPVRLRGARHSRDRDRQAVQYHYDVGNAFYALWLDRRMQYTSAYFPTGNEDLDTAQELKLEHICRKLRLKPGQSLLDIGCGWGGLALYAAAKYGVRVLGVTLSEEQARYAERRVAEAWMDGQVTIKRIDYRNLGHQLFDRIVSVGMFEHIGRDQLGGYFDQAWSRLRPGGLFLNHGIALRPSTCGISGARPARWRRALGRCLIGHGKFSQRHIFPDSELLPVSEVNLVAERAGFEVRDVENLREHYALTCRHWARRLEERAGEAIRLTDPVTFRTWRVHLASSINLFETGALSVHQTLLSRMEDGRTHLPLTRADLYAADLPASRSSLALAPRAHRVSGVVRDDGRTSRRRDAPPLRGFPAPRTGGSHRG